MSEAIVVAPKDFQETVALSKYLSLSALLPLALRKKPEDIALIVMRGGELGIPPTTALGSIHVINGKASMSADLMGALVKKRKDVCEYLHLAESNAKIATYRTKRQGEPGETILSFTIEEAKAAGLLGNPTWSKYPAAMLRARALAAICRAVYPDLCLGLYDSDSGEISDPRPELDVSAPTEAPAEQTTHVETVKETLKAVFSKEQPITDAEIVTTPAAVLIPEQEQGPVEAKPLTLAERLEAVTTPAELNALGAEMVALPKEQRLALREAWTRKSAEITAAKK